jgi:hypothetical protein
LKRQQIAFQQELKQDQAKDIRGAHYEPVEDQQRILDAKNYVFAPFFPPTTYETSNTTSF